ncbi:hypothetical protein GQ600_19212 [Phytophthora cactorum]|nr:hypothetical protein GQ600_19212 [Phytophthora cactorum]
MESLRQRTAAFATELYKEVMCEVHRTRLDVATVVVALRCHLTGFATARPAACSCRTRAAVEVTGMVRSDWQIIWDLGL